MSETFVGPASTRSFSVVIFAGSLTDNEPPVRFADKDSGFGRPPRKDKAGDSVPEDANVWPLADGPLVRYGGNI